MTKDNAGLFTATAVHDNTDKRGSMKKRETMRVKRGSVTRKTNEQTQQGPGFKNMTRSL